MRRADRRAASRRTARVGGGPAWVRLVFLIKKLLAEGPAEAPRAELRLSGMWSRAAP